MSMFSRAHKWLERFSLKACAWTGTSWAFLVAVGIILLWLVTGPIFHFSDTWQLVINTGTTIVTFIMVFLIQRAQNKEALVTQLKLDELVAAIKGASNSLIDVERLSEKDLETLHRHFQELAKMAHKHKSITESHSVEEAAARHHGKLK